MKKQLFKNKREDIRGMFSILDCISIAEMIEQLEDLSKKYGSAARIEVDIYDSWPERSSVNVEVIYDRMETDKEFNARKKRSAAAKISAPKRAEAAKKKKEAKDLKELKRLAKKYHLKVDFDANN